MKSPFVVRRTGNQDLDRVQAEFADALETVAQAIPETTKVASFVVLGSNGIGTVALPPIKNNSGTILRRAEVAMRVAAVANLTDLTDVQTSFAATITTPDQIKQVATTNLSAKKLLVVVVQ